MDKVLLFNTDRRPQRHGWAPGNYSGKCSQCEKDFIGDKRASMCADCAYAIPDKTPEQLLIEAYQREKVDNAIYTLSKLNIGHFKKLKHLNPKLAEFIVNALTLED